MATNSVRSKFSKKVRGTPLEGRKVSIGTFYLTRQADIWWSWGVIKEKRKVVDFAWVEFLKLWREKFYLISAQRNKEQEFQELS